MTAARAARWEPQTAAGRVRTALVILLLGYLAAQSIMWAISWPDVWVLLTHADHAVYLEQARRVLAGGPLYPAWELAGPFTPEQWPEVYPPATVYGLFVPMALLPTPLWWLIPLGTVATVTVLHRPRGWTLVAVLGLLAAPTSWWITVAAGNPSMWAAAGVALATLRPPWAILALIKPTLAPLALLGVRSRRWWLLAGAYAVVALVMLPAWIDYGQVLINYRSPLSVPVETPLLLIPLVAWLGRRARGSAEDGAPHDARDAGPRVAEGVASRTTRPGR